MTDGAAAPYRVAMRYLPALALLAACASDPAPTGDAGPPGDLGASDAGAADAGADAGATIDTPPGTDAGATEDAGEDAGQPTTDTSPIRPLYGTCSAGMDCALPTACEQVALRGDGGAFGTICTASCSGGDARMCPSYVAGQVECVNAAEDPSVFRCVRICAADPDCAPLGLRCRQTTLAGGVGASVCLP